MKTITLNGKKINSKLNTYLKLLKSGLLLFGFSLLAGTGFSQQTVNDYNFSGAKVVVPANLNKTEQAAVQMLVDEVKKRTIIELTADREWPGSNTPVIAVGTSASFNDDPNFNQYDLGSSNNEAEGFTVKFMNHVRNSPTLFIIGNDSRGMLFGTGYFLTYIAATHHQCIDLLD